MEEVLVQNLRAINPLASNQSPGLVSDDIFLDLYWDDVNTEVEKYIVYKSLDNTTWDKLGETTYIFFRDETFNDKKEAWYAVSYLTQAGEESSKSKEIKYSITDPHKWNMYRQSWGTARKTEVLFDYVAEQAEVYLANHTGKRCDCYNFNQEAAATNCPLCGGSGFISGFFRFTTNEEDPQIRIYNAGESIDFYPFGRVIVNAPTALTLGTPVMRAGDFIYRNNNPEGINRLYRIEDVHLKAFKGFITFQRYSLDEKGMDFFDSPEGFAIRQAIHRKV